MLIILSKWAVQFNITNTTFSALLKCLKSHKCFNSFPSDARTILKPNSLSNSKDIQLVPPGIYHHFGISNGLNSSANVLNPAEETIRLLIGIDGLPLAKSSSSTFWPILGCVRYQIKSLIFLIGLYWGKDKPQDSNIFLKNMVDELGELSKNGLITKFGKKNVVEGFCCDAPARSFILNTKGHTGFFSCSRCTTEGIYLENRVCFPGVNFIKRTHSDFLNRTNDEYHVTNSVSLITEIQCLDIIYNFPLDYMHLICLGVMKKLILLWTGSLSLKQTPVSVRLQNKKVQTITDHLLLLKSSITSDFSRRPRGLNEVPRWKATEYRLFLLYTGPVVLQGMLNEDCYSHFICLHVCIRILLTTNIECELVNFCEKVLIYFVDKFGKLYGKQFISHNVHGLLHIVDDYNQYGSLDNCSCFPFENYLQFLKKMVWKFEKPLEQVINRYNEYLSFSEPKDSFSEIKSNIEMKKPHNEGPLINHCTGPQFKCIIVNHFKINTKSIVDCYIGFIKDEKLHICKVKIFV